MFILPTLAVTGIAAVAGLPIAAAVLAAAAIFLIQFFRDPERTPEGGPDAIVSPADGTVLSITEAPECPPGRAGGSRSSCPFSTATSTGRR